MDDEVVKKILSDHDREELVKLLDDALQRWLDKQFSAFGRWSAVGASALVFAALVYLYIHTGGLK